MRPLLAAASIKGLKNVCKRSFWTEVNELLFLCQENVGLPYCNNLTTVPLT